MDEQVVITGAGGRIGRMMRSRLARPGRTLRLVDTGPQQPAGDGEAAEVYTADFTDATAMATVCNGADAIIHLGGVSTENTWDTLLRVNVGGARTVLETACAAKVSRVVVASSVHATGFYCRPGARPHPAGVPAPRGVDGVPATAPARPDTYYGVTKAAVEALASLYADRFGMTVYALRLGDCAPEPPGEWALHSWLSPDDCARLLQACLSADVTGYRVVWGISRNSRRWWSLQEGREIGYEPVDDAEVYADRVDPAQGERAATLGLVGGRHTTVALGVPR